MTVERIVAVQPSNNNSLTYGFFHTSTINPGTARVRRMRRAVAQYVEMTFTRRDVKNVRIIKVRRSPNEEARGVAMLSVHVSHRKRVCLYLDLFETFSRQGLRMT
jgi:hypothetical protein